MTSSSIEPMESQESDEAANRAGRARFSALRRLTILGLLLVIVALAVIFWRPNTAAEPVDRDVYAKSTSASKPLNMMRSATEQRRREGLLEAYENVDPEKAGWDTEVVNDLASGQLKQLGKLLAHPDQIDGDHLQQFATDACTSDALRPENLETVFSDDCLVVQRTIDADEASSAPALALADALKLLCAPYEGSDDVRVKFKIIRVEATETSAETSAYFQAAGRFQRGTVQQSATWHCRWSRSGESQLLLESVRVEDYEEVVNRGNRGKWLVDCTESVIGGNPCYREELLFGSDHWCDRIDSRHNTNSGGYHGLAIGDVNGDGLEDVYVSRVGGLPNRLFLQQPDGTATEAAAKCGVDFLDNSQCSLLIDLDNDGDLDLAAALDWGLAMMSNDGYGRFTLMDRVPLEATPYSLAAADYDNDKDLDIYICIYSKGMLMEGIAAPVPIHDANNGGENILLTNYGNWRFINDAKEVGLGENNSRFSLAASWEDFDNDGDLDLYVANDYGRNNLYRNDNGHFKDIAAQAGVEDIAAGMSVSWGDYNNDGLVDLYVANMFSSAGNRVAYQRNFKTDANEETLGQYQRFARGNSLFENAGDGTFRDVSVPAAVTMGRWAWCSLFVDLNNDGLQDIYVANGMLTRPEDSGDL